MINNSILDVFNYKPERENNILQISNSIINSLCFPAFEIGAKVVIENCNIGTLMINNTWFEAGLVLRNTIVKSRIEYEAGGHNKSPIIIENNIFEEYFNFFDCQFKEQVIKSWVDVDYTG